jgi:hypothetical protein
MKTFEERYTAWIDGRLEGNALGGFEQELSRRAAATEAQADKADAGRLRSLLRANLQAPVLTNAEFFSLQIRERIEAERGVSRRPGVAPEAASSWLGWFTGPVTRLVGLGAAALFVAGALYYGMMPPHAGAPGASVVRVGPPTRHDVGHEATVALAAATPPRTHQARSGDDLMARNDVATPDDIDDESPGFAARVPDPATTTATATPLHYKDANVNVLWINGLDYMPAIPAAPATAGGSPAPASSEGPDASMNPHHG